MRKYALTYTILDRLVQPVVDRLHGRAWRRIIAIRRAVPEHGVLLARAVG